MATMIQISGQGKNRETEEKYSYTIQGYVIESRKSITEFKGIMEYSKDAKKTTVYGTIANGKLCFVETRKNGSSQLPISIVHDITLYNDNNGLGITMAVAQKAIYSSQTYPISTESVSISREYLQDDVRIDNLRQQIKKADLL